MSDTKRSPRRRSAGKGSKSSSKNPTATDAAKQDHVCLEPGCGKVCKSAGGLATHRRCAHPPAPAAPEMESPTDAVERVLATLTLLPKQAVLVATIRALAKTLEQCEPTDTPKTAKELTSLMHELLADDTQKPEQSWTDDE